MPFSFDTISSSQDCGWCPLRGTRLTWSTVILSRSQIRTSRKWKSLLEDQSSLLRPVCGDLEFVWGCLRPACHDGTYYRILTKVCSSPSLSSSIHSVLGLFLIDWGGSSVLFARVGKCSLRWNWELWEFWELPPAASSLHHQSFEFHRLLTARIHRTQSLSFSARPGLRLKLILDQQPDF